MLLHPWSLLLHGRVQSCLSQVCCKGEPGWRSSDQQLTGCAEEGFAEGAGRNQMRTADVNGPKGYSIPYDIRWKGLWTRWELISLCFLCLPIAWEVLSHCFYITSYILSYVCKYVCVCVRASITPVLSCLSSAPCFAHGPASLLFLALRFARVDESICLCTFLFQLWCQAERQLPAELVVSETRSRWRWSSLCH